MLQDVLTLSYRTQEKRQLHCDTSHLHAVLLSAQHFGGYNKRYQHNSTVLNCPMKVRLAGASIMYSLMSSTGLDVAVICTPESQRTFINYVYALLIVNGPSTQFYVYWPPAAEEHKVPVRKLLCFNALHSMLAVLMQYHCHNDSKELDSGPAGAVLPQWLDMHRFAARSHKCMQTFIDGLQHALCASIASKSLAARVTFRLSLSSLAADENFTEKV